MADIALGVIPLAVMALNGFNILQSRLKTFRRADRLVRRWGRELRGHARMFREACRSVLGHAIPDPSTIANMFKDAMHMAWKDPELESQLAAILGDRYDDWVETVSDIGEAIKDLSSMLDSFSALLPPSEQDRDPGQVRRLAQRLKASFKEEDVEKLLKELGKLNRQLGELQTGLTSSIPATHHHSQSSGQAISPFHHGAAQNIGRQRRAAHGVFEGISAIWRCGAVSMNHSRHALKLFVQPASEPTTEGDCVTTKLGYAYEPAHSSQEIRLLEFQVRSGPLPTPVSMPTPEPDLMESMSEARPAPGPAPCKRRRKVLRWADEEERLAQQRSTATFQTVLAVDTEKSVGVDFRQCHDLCWSMTQPVVKVCPQTGLNSLGYIDTMLNEGFRHLIYPTGRDICGKPTCSVVETGDVLALSDIFDQHIDGYLQIRDRIQLAQSLVRMVLTLHSTPWLARRWTLQDLSFVRRGDDLVASLESLHLNAQLPLSGNKSMDVTMQLTPNSSDCSWAADEPLCGSSSRNDPLWSLGLALLQTDCWSTIAWETGRGDGGGDDRVVQQYLKSRPGIGVRFREITEQCLSGRFRCGSADLNNPHVESELLGVVSEMDVMMSSLEKLGL